MRSKRTGYTLVEMVLVLLLLVVLAALAYPVVDNMYASSRLSAASDTVRARWSDARTHATEERRPYRFAIKDNTGSFRIAPDTDEFWDDGEEDLLANDQEAFVLEGSLPDRVYFGSSDASGADGAAQEWRKLVTFQPDGSASDDVEVSFATSGASPVILRLRATTGTATTVALPRPQRDS